MEKPTINSNTIWNDGAKYGLILGIFTSLFTFSGILTGPLSQGGAGLRVLAVALNAGLWLVKFLGCLWILRFFMLKFSMSYSHVTNKNTYRLGMVMAASSALIVSAVQLLNITVISPEIVDTAVATSKEMMQSLGSASESEMIALDRIVSKMPMISFFTSFFYCLIYGIAASAIFSSSIPPKDIFAENDGEDNQ